MSSPPPPPIKALTLIFPGADMLDYVGPLEMLHSATHNPPDPNSGNRQHVFAIKTVAHTTSSLISTGGGALNVQADLSITSLLQEGGEAGVKLEDFQILVVPGGSLNVMTETMGPDRAEMKLIRRFASLAPGKAGEERTLLSVCSGAFLLGAAGLLAGLKVTTHHMGLKALEEICEASGGPVKQVVGGDGLRFVDSGVVDLKEGGRLRIITAGGVSSGLDAALHLVEVVAGKQVAGFAATIVEYERRQV